MTRGSFLKPPVARPIPVGRISGRVAASGTEYPLLGRVSEEFDEMRMAAVWLKVSNNGKAEGTKIALQLADDATLQEIKENGRCSLEHKRAKERLMEGVDVEKSAAYDALKLHGGWVLSFADEVRRPDWAEAGSNRG